MPARWSGGEGGGAGWAGPSDDARECRIKRGTAETAGARPAQASEQPDHRIFCQIMCGSGPGRGLPGGSSCFFLLLNSTFLSLNEINVV
jgi:hypothetical protein